MRVVILGGCSFLDLLTCLQPFKHITDLTDVLEGSIVRCISRLDETTREVMSAARMVGDTSLYKKMEEAEQEIKRDIVFAASLVSLLPPPIKRGTITNTMTVHSTFRVFNQIYISRRISIKQLKIKLTKKNVCYDVVD